jgi:hypothetical protein
MSTLDILSEDEQAMVGIVRDFVDKEVRPVVQELDHTNTYPESLIEQMKELGIYGLAVPEEYGGTPVSTPCYVLITEELARGWMSLAGAMGGHSVVAKLLTHFGTEEQKRRHLPGMATGQIRATMALTEPGGGSDLQAMRTVARRARAAGLGFLRIPANYYDDLAAHFALDPGELEELRALDLFYDRVGDGEPRALGVLGGHLHHPQPPREVRVGGIHGEEAVEERPGLVQAPLVEVGVRGLRDGVKLRVAIAADLLQRGLAVGPGLHQRLSAGLPGGCRSRSARGHGGRGPRSRRCGRRHQ